MRIKLYSLCFSAALSISILPTTLVRAQPQPNPTQTLKPNVNINADCNGYLEYLPQGYDPNGSTLFPLLVYFPGISQSGNGNTDLTSLLDINPPKYIAQDINNHLSSFTVNGQTFRFIMITPQWIQPITTRYPTVDEMNDIINYAIEKYKVDKSRIYLMGISTGAGEVWHYASANSFYANRIAAMVPFSGTDTPTHAKAAVLVNSQMPIWAFHNSSDGEVPQYYTLGWGDSIKFVNGGTFYSPIPKFTIWTTTDPLDHNSWDDKPVQGIGPIVGTYTENSLNIYQWMLQYTRAVSNTNLAPTASAGPNISIVAPNSSVQLNALAKDLDTYTLTYNWTQMSGPNTGSFSSTNTTSTTVTGLVEGTYVFRFSVNDGNSTTNSNVTVTVLPPGSLTKIEAELYGTQNHTFVNNNPAMSNGQFLSYKDQFAWSKYTINTNGGTFNFSFSVMSPYSKTLQIIVGSSVLGTVNVPATGSSWQTVTATGISLPSGVQTLQIAPTGGNWFPGGILQDSLSVDYLTFISSSNAALPVKFVYSNAQCNGNTVNLQWKTAQEQNTKEFSIQRSTDGTNWTEIGKSTAAGQSSQERSYLFVDKNPSANSMYRIVETDIAGQQTMSSIVRSSCSSIRNEITLYPNPNTGVSALNVSFPEATSITFQVLDIKGAVMQQKQIQLPAGSSTVPVNITNYPNGVYTIAVRYNGEMKTIKMIKK
jgi:hypothetical protein